MAGVFLSSFASLLIGAAPALAATNNGTINQVLNGFSSLKECEATAESVCGSDTLAGLRKVLDLTTVGQCVTGLAGFERAKIDLPKCPGSLSELRGLDNTHPTGALFALYYGRNDNFIYDVAKNYLASSKAGKFNLIVVKGEIGTLLANPELVKLLNNERVNIVEVAAMPKVKQWMQDSFQFAAVDGKPALVQLEHRAEMKMDYGERFGCELSRKCDLPYYVPSEMVGSKADKTELADNLNSGGNLEVLPGGTFYRGILKTDGLSEYQPEGAAVPYQTAYQAKQNVALEKAGNRVLDLDVSFLRVGHVDEIFNVVRTNAPAPCNYAILAASPQKAFELMEEAARNAKGGALRCVNHGYEKLRDEGRNGIISEARVQKVYEALCINDKPVEKYVASEEFQVLKGQNLDPGSPAQIARIMKENQDLLAAELKERTGCANPEFIPIPVFFRDGVSYAPDTVNGVIETSGSSPSSAILPRTFFAPFDNYVEKELGKRGVKTMLTYDMMYHLMSGEVHCGTNDARVCRP